RRPGGHDERNCRKEQKTSDNEGPHQMTGGRRHASAPYDLDQCGGRNQDRGFHKDGNECHRLSPCSRERFRSALSRLYSASDSAESLVSSSRAAIAELGELSKNVRTRSLRAERPASSWVAEGK